MKQRLPVLVTRELAGNRVQILGSTEVLLVAVTGSHKDNLYSREPGGSLKWVQLYDNETNNIIQSMESARSRLKYRLSQAKNCYL